MKAIGYIRCSTHEQADSGLGLDAQEGSIRAYCALKGLDISQMVTDPGVSGGKPLAKRPGGNTLLKHLQHRGTCVVMLKLDRGFRNAADCLNTVERWDKSGVALHVVDLGGNAIDTTSAAGRFMLVVLAGAAEMERNLTRERTRSAMAVKKANGHRVGTVPFGHDLSTNGTTLVPNEAEQAIIEDIRNMREAGMTLKQIAGALTERNVPTKTGRSLRWTHQAVARIVTGWGLFGVYRRSGRHHTARRSRAGTGWMVFLAVRVQHANRVQRPKDSTARRPLIHLTPPQLGGPRDARFRRPRRREGYTLPRRTIDPST